MIKVSLVIPTYNEVNNLPPLLEEIFGQIDKEKIDLEVTIVDDSSPDGTGKVADDLKRLYPIKVIHRVSKLGLGSAVREGFSRSDRDILGAMDADLSHDPVIINNLILSLEDNDIAIGSRFEKGSQIEKWTLPRKLVSGTGVFLARLLTGTKDPLSGYFFLNREVVRDINLSTNGYKILLEILVKGKYDKIQEFPYTFRMRKFSASKLNVKEFLLFLSQIIKYSGYKLFKNYGREKHN